MTLRVSDWQSKSYLDSIRSSGDSFYLVKHTGYQSYRRPTTIYLLYFRLLYFLFGGAQAMPITGDIHLLSQDAEAIRPTHDKAWIGLWHIPHICQVWGTTTLFRPVKGAPKSTLICDKMAKTGQNLAFLMLLGAPAWKKNTTAGRGSRDQYEVLSYASPPPQHLTR